MLELGRPMADKKHRRGADHSPVGAGVNVELAAWKTSVKLSAPFAGSTARFS